MTTKSLLPALLMILRAGFLLPLQTKYKYIYITTDFNPNSIGVKYSLIVLSLLTFLPFNKKKSSDEPYLKLNKFFFQKKILYHLSQSSMSFHYISKGHILLEERLIRRYYISPNDDDRFQASISIYRWFISNIFIITTRVKYRSIDVLISDYKGANLTLY